MGKTTKKTTEQAIKEAKKVHGDKYDYSRFVYVNQNTEAIIGCPIHGWFKQKPKLHILRGHGCPECGRFVGKGKDSKNYKGKKHIYYNTESFKEKLKEIYGEKYDLSKVEYKNSHEKVILICPIHGEFKKAPCKLLKGQGCQKCNKKNAREKIVDSIDKCIDDFNKVHHGLYDYSHVEYINNSTNVMITCRKHGDFPCTPANHKKGRGCPICKAEHNVYEEKLYYFLKTFIDEKEIIRQYRTEWLTENKSLDFFIPKYNIAIEHQGSQHYYKMRYENDTNCKLERRINNDKIKYDECIKNNVYIFYFTYELTKKPENCFHELIFKEEELKNKILNKLKNE